MNVRLIGHFTDDYLRAVELRRVVLRFPLGLDYTQEQLLSEHDSHHFILEDGDVIVGSAMSTPLPNGQIKIRQVAIEPSWQGQGLGKILMLGVEDHARTEGFTEAILHARQVAVAFYEAIGYEIIDEPFEEVGIPHRKMRKAISSVG